MPLQKGNAQVDKGGPTWNIMEEQRTTKTQHAQYRLPAAAIMEIIESMTGEATLYKAEHGIYYNLSPVTNMETVEFNFYSLHRDGYENMEGEDTFANIEATLRRSRRWGFSISDSRED